MLQITVIGNIGSNAELRNENGNEFVTFKVAHNDRWTDAQGVQHDKTVWVSCVMNGRADNLIKYLTKGTQVFVCGDGEVRTYHSQAARALVAGINLRVRSIQLIGGRPDDVPAVLFDKDGREVRISKFYWSAGTTEKELYSRNGEVFNVGENGWVTPQPSEQPSEQQEQTSEPQQQEQEQAKEQPKKSKK